MTNEDVLPKANPPKKKPRNRITWTDAEPQGSPLGLTSLDPSQTHLPLEVRKKLTARVGCYICVEQHWKETQGTSHQKTSELFGRCKRRVRFRNPRPHPCFEQERNTDFQSFSLILPPFCPTLHACFRPNHSPQSHPKLLPLNPAWTTPVPWEVPENAKLCLCILKHRKITRKVWTMWLDTSRQLSREQKTAAPVQYSWISPRHLTWNHTTGENYFTWR